MYGKKVDRRRYFLFGILCFLTFFVLKDTPNTIQNKFAYHRVFSGMTKEPWQIEEGKYCRVYYTDGLEDAEMTARIADSYYPMVAADFAWNRKDKLVFVLYQDGAAMAKALGMKEEESVPMGAYCSQMVAVLSPSNWTQEQENWLQVEDFLENGPIVHEMVHFALDEKAGGPYPLWFSEGVALFYEKKYTGFEWRADLKGCCHSISMEDLAYRFQDLDTDMAYRKSYECVAGFVERYGEDVLQKRISALHLQKPSE